MKQWQLGLLFTLFPSLLLAQSPVTFSTQAGAAPDSISIIMQTGIEVFGGQVAVRIDPEAFAIATVTPGQVFQQVLKNAQILINQQTFDAGGAAVTGGLLMGWVNSKSPPFVPLPSGTYELLSLQLAPNLPGGSVQQNCALIDFVDEGLRSGPDSPILKNGVSSDDGTRTIFADTIDVQICICDPDLQIATNSLPEATEGTAYSTSVAFSGGTPPVAWSPVNPAQLPSGLLFDPATGAVSGTPLSPSAGVYSVTFQVCDACARGTFCVQKLLSLTVKAKPAANPPSGGGEAAAGAAGRSSPGRPAAPATPSAACCPTWRSWPLSWRAGSTGKEPSGARPRYDPHPDRRGA
ncbi:MAG: putative Ig domain-containing protein [Planctomycetes bacterium]|nr:putative Ig domain-containing protein [Planctomycetota bacterium]